MVSVLNVMYSLVLITYILLSNLLKKMKSPYYNDSTLATVLGILIGLVASYVNLLVLEAWRHIPGQYLLL